MKFLFSLIFSIFLSLPILAQIDADEVSDIFDKNERTTSQSKFVLFFATTDIIRGGLPISVECQLPNRISLEAGAGLILPYYLPEFGIGKGYELRDTLGAEWGSYDGERLERFENPKLGYNYFASVNFYLSELGPLSSFLGLQVRRTHYNFEAADMRDTDWRLGYTVRAKGQKWTFDYVFGFGLRWKETNPTQRFDGYQKGTFVVCGLRMGRNL